MCILALTGCGTYHTGIIGINASTPELHFVPKEAKISIDTYNKVTGIAECSSILWVFNSAPNRQTYGVPIQANEGNFASSECVAAAIYDALKNTDADTMYGLQYTTVKNGFLCFGNNCFIGKTKIIVNGYAGKIESITDKTDNIDKKKNNTLYGSSL